MHTYSCSGTLGDTYINLCILYQIAIRKRITCVHYTKHKKWHELIRQIYSLMPNICVEFVSKRDAYSHRIHSCFEHQIKSEGILSSPSEWHPFPLFIFPAFSSLPEKYVVLNPQSGKEKQGRILTQKVIHETIETASHPVIVIGTGKISEQIQGDNVINLTNKTSLLEAMGISSMAQSAVMFEGLMGMVALSHRVKSDIYIGHIEDKNFAKWIKTNPDSPYGCWSSYCRILVKE